MTDYIVKISKPGYSVHDEINKQNYIFRSDLVSMTMKSIFHPSITTVAVEGPYGTESHGNVIIAHNFGYVPKFIAFVTGSDDTYYSVPGGRTVIVEEDKYDELYEDFNAEIDENYLYLTIVAYHYDFVRQVSFETTAFDYTYNFDVILFMERLGVGLPDISTHIKTVSAKGRIV